MEEEPFEIEELLTSTVEDKNEGEDKEEDESVEDLIPSTLSEEIPSSPPKKKKIAFSKSKSVKKSKSTSKSKKVKSKSKPKSKPKGKSKDVSTPINTPPTPTNTPPTPTNTPPTNTPPTPPTPTPPTNTLPIFPSLPSTLKEPSLSIFLVFYNSNRPSSLTELSLSFPKKALEASLVDLVEKGFLLCKLYKKTKIYMLNSETCGYEEEEVYEERLSVLTSTLESLRVCQKSLQRDLQDIKNQLTVGEIRDKITLLKEQTDLNSKNILKIERGELVKEEEIEKMKKKIKDYEKIKRERGSIFKNVIEILCDKLDKKKGELLEEIGI